MNSLRTQLPITLLLFVLAACSDSDGDSSSSGAGDGEIDTSRFFFPESSRTMSYERFSCSSTSPESCSLDYTITETWEVEQNIFSVVEVNDQLDDVSKDTITVEENSISVISLYIPEGEDESSIEPEEYAIERFQKTDVLIRRENDTETMYFGPFDDASYDFFGQTFDSDRLLIAVSKYINQVPEGAPQTYDMEVDFYSDGEGHLGYVYFYDCSGALELSLDTDFEGLCSSAFGDLLIE